MPTHVYKVDRSKAPQIAQITQDEIVSRLSIVTKESEVLGVPGDCLYVLLDGNDAGLARAKELFEGQNVGRQVPPEIRDQVQKAIKDEEESAAEGMGALFG